MDKSTSHNPIQRRMNKECKVLFLLYYCCGLRLSEGRLLKKENIDLETGILTILGSKGQKDRLVYLPDDGIRFLNIYKCDMESAFPELQANSLLLSHPESARTIVSTRICINQGSPEKQNR